MQTNSLDPFSVWKSIYNEMEPKVSSAMQKWLESEEYAEFSGQFLSTTLQMEQQFVKAFEQMMHTYTLPTLKDFARLGEMIVALENKVDELEEHLDDRFTSLEKQLAGIAERIDTFSKETMNELAKKATREGTTRTRRRSQTENAENEESDGNQADSESV